MGDSLFSKLLPKVVRILNQWQSKEESVEFLAPLCRAKIILLLGWMKADGKLDNGFQFP